MADLPGIQKDNVERIKQLGALYWQPTLTLVATVAAASETLPSLIKGHFSLNIGIWVSALVIVIVVVRFPKPALFITRLILGSPPRSATLPRLFRLNAYLGKEQLPGREAEAYDLWTALQRQEFLILEGESGCGKTSLANTVLEQARAAFRVVRIEVSERFLAGLIPKTADASGEAEKVNSTILKASLLTLADSTKATDSEFSLPTLLVLDQFEQLFVTVPQSFRVSFLQAVADLVGERKARVFLIVRNDFIDLLMQLCRSVDKNGSHLRMENYYSLEAFTFAKAKAALCNILSPVVGADVLLQQQISEFADVVNSDLLRAPRDPRLCRSDPKTVLPVELQIVGMMLESMGPEYFSASAYLNEGGKAGLIKGYIDKNTLYVFRKSGVGADKSLLVLRELVGSKTKQMRSVSDVSSAVGLAPEVVKQILDSYADCRLVKRLPPEIIDEPLELAKYEFIHDYIGEVLTNAPTPVLQQARDAHERLSFWSDRTGSVWPNNQKPPSLKRRLRQCFNQPIPVPEMLSLWKYANTAEQKLMLRRNLNGFALKICIVLVVIAIGGSAVASYTLTEGYIRRRVLATAPVDEAIAEGRFENSDAITAWAIALTNADRTSDAVIVIRRLSDQHRSEALAKVGIALLKKGKREESRAMFADAETEADTIVSEFWRQISYEELCYSLARAHDYENARRVAHKIHSPRAQVIVLGIVGQYIWRDKRPQDADAVWQEAADIALHGELGSLEELAERIAFVGQADRATALLKANHLNENSELDSIIARGMAKNGRLNEAVEFANEHLENLQKKIETLRELADIAQSQSRTTEAQNILKQCLEYLPSIAPDESRKESEADIARSLIQAGNLDKGKELLFDSLKGHVLEEMDEDGGGMRMDDLARLDAFYSLLTMMAKSGQPDQAKELANKQQDRRVKVRALSLIEGTRANDDPNAAIAAAHLIADVEVRSNTLVDLAHSLQKSGKTKEAVIAAKEAFLAALQIPVPKRRSSAIVAAGQALVSMRHLHDVYEMAMRCPPSGRIILFSAILDSMSGTNNADERTDSEGVEVITT